MVAGAGKMAEERGFGFEFLDVILAESAQTGVVSLAEGFGGKDLGDGQKEDFRGIAMRTFGGADDAFANGGEAAGEGFGRGRQDSV